MDALLTADGLLALATLSLTALDRVDGGLPYRLARRLLLRPASALAERLWIDRGDDRRIVPGELVLNYVVTARR